MAKDPYEAKHDFGFTFEHDRDISLEDELSTLKDKLEYAQTAITELQKMIYPLLDNLMKEPTKSTIKWPNRIEKVKEFKEKLDKFVTQTIGHIE